MSRMLTRRSHPLRLIDFFTSEYPKDLRMRRILLRCLFVLTATTFCVDFAAGIEQLKVRDIPEEFDWGAYARNETVVQISGRYDGRLSKQFRMVKLSISLTPSRTTVLPNDLEKGQRISATGVVRRVGSRYILEATRIVIGSSDIDKVLSAARRLEENEPEKMYVLTELYEPIAKFYGDEDLLSELTLIRSAAFLRQRQDSADNATRLDALAKRGASLKISPELVAATRFEALVVESKSESVEPAKFLDEITEKLPGWDMEKVLEPKVESEFLKTPITVYNAANAEQRSHLHRRLYRQIRLPELLKLASKDGSNSLEISQRIEKELPEELESIADLQKRYITYRLNRVSELRRRELFDLQTLLKRFGREDEFQKAVNDWVIAQEKRLTNGQLDGALNSAEANLFASEQWKHPKHRERGIQLLKKAWKMTHESAPKEAENIEQRLEGLGWIRLRDKWMSKTAVESLPKDDIDLAMRERRVVTGMQPHQILATMGEPAKRIRVVSAKSVQEIWIFGEGGSTAITVHLHRLRGQSPSDALSTLVGTITR